MFHFRSTFSINWETVTCRFLLQYTSWNCPVDKGPHRTMTTQSHEHKKQVYCKTRTITNNCTDNASVHLSRISAMSADDLLSRVLYGNNDFFWVSPYNTRNYCKVIFSYKIMAERWGNRKLCILRHKRLHLKSVNRERNFSSPHCAGFRNS